MTGNQLLRHLWGFLQATFHRNLFIAISDEIKVGFKKCELVIAQ